MTEPSLKDQVAELIRDNQVLLFMKGTPDQPRCGFSMRVVNVLEAYGVEYGAIDVLPALQPLREVTAEISDWQTFPQLYVNGELVGGCRNSRGDGRVGRACAVAGSRAAGASCDVGEAGTAGGRPAAEPADPDRALLALGETAG